jgi:hypothetical protein
MVDEGCVRTFDKNQMEDLPSKTPISIAFM